MASSSNDQRQTAFPKREFSEKSVLDIERWAGEPDNLVTEYIDNEYLFPIDYTLINAFLLLVDAKKDYISQTFTDPEQAAKQKAEQTANIEAATMDWVKTAHDLLKVFKEVFEDYDEDEKVEHKAFFPPEDPDDDIFKSLEFIKGLVINSIMRFYYRIFSQLERKHTFETYLGRTSNEVVLYHGLEGLNGSMKLRLKNLKTNELYITPIFLATSLLQDIAANFATHPRQGYEDEDEQGIILEITIPQDKYNAVPYIYFGNNIKNICDHKQVECEILLNLFTSLKLTEMPSTETITFPQQISPPLIIRGEIVPRFEDITRKFTIYKFVWESNYYCTEEELAKILISDPKTKPSEICKPIQSIEPSEPSEPSKPSGPSKSSELGGPSRATRSKSKLPGGRVRRKSRKKSKKKKARKKSRKYKI